MREKIFLPIGRDGREMNSKKAAEACSAVAKTLAKMDHPRGSGLLRTGELKKLVSLTSYSVDVTGPFVFGNNRLLVVVGERHHVELPILIDLCPCSVFHVLRGT